MQALLIFSGVAAAVCVILACMLSSIKKQIKAQETAHKETVNAADILEDFAGDAGTLAGVTGTDAVDAAAELMRNDKKAK